MKKRVLKWELIGIAVITVIGSVLHFAFELSGEWEPVGVIAAVNESVWEHFKIGFWPALFYAAFEYKFLKNITNNFIIGKVTGIYAIPIAIAVLFYAYSSITGQEILIVDILIFIIAIAVGQIASYKILTAQQFSRRLNITGLALVILLAITFIVFTFYPPHLPVFRDALTGTYGIVK